MPGPRKVLWRQVIGALASDQTRSWFVGRLRESRFDADSFATKTRARAFVASTLTALEDRLELTAPRSKERNAIRTVRRRLEEELWL